MVFGKKDVVVYKDSNVCILIQMIGANKEFYNEFSKITQEGYELKSIFAPSSTFLGIGGAPQAWHYFQKLSTS